MGCSNSREDITAEEAAVRNSESILEYANIPCIQLDMIHRKYSYEGKIHMDQWKDICIELQLAPSKSYTKQQILNFFDNFKLGPSEYSLKKLLVLGIQLSSGSSHEKAKLLYEVQDEKGKGSLNKQEIEQLIGIMIEIPVEVNPKIMTKCEVNDVSEQDLRNYIVKLRKGKNKAVENAVNGIMEENDEINSEEFINKMTIGNKPLLLSAHGVRTFVKSCLPEGHSRAIKINE
ncbi:hypothetical protein SteCoe_15597 [Stentor coeruleus]|uniref:EF-hand domain-containing protein n=1 Tax=Stentor coeruleus TaxID=5963 RepID=A0A1R2C379_9CILI|nr:hypothetical protein SteCoe_15597 [Stentor coeruleus]